MKILYLMDHFQLELQIMLKIYYFILKKTPSNQFFFLNSLLIKILNNFDLTPNGFYTLHNFFSILIMTQLIIISILIILFFSFF